jgi:hypothetical protein
MGEIRFLKIERGWAQPEMCSPGWIQRARSPSAKGGESPTTIPRPLEHYWSRRVRFGALRCLFMPLY